MPQFLGIRTAGPNSNVTVKDMNGNFKKMQTPSGADIRENKIPLKNPPLKEKGKGNVLVKGNGGTVTKNGVTFLH